MDSTLDRLLVDPEFRRLYAEEGFVVEVMENLSDWMLAHNISRAELARRLGTSRANVTQMMNGRNVSLRTVASAVHAAGGVPHLSIVPAADDMLNLRDESRPLLRLIPGGRGRRPRLTRDTVYRWKAGQEPGHVRGVGVA